MATVNMTSLNTPYLLLTGVVIISVAVLFTVLQPMMDEINVIQSTIATDTESLRTKQEFLASLDVKVKQLQLQLDVERQLATVLPETDRVQDIIRILNEYANQSGLTTISVTNNSSRQEAQNNATRARGEGVVVPESVRISAFGLTIAGSYEQVRLFLGLLEKSPRILDVTSVSLKEAAGQPGRVDASITMQLYSQQKAQVPGL